MVAGFGLLTPASPAEGLAIAGRELRQRRLDQRQAALTLGFGQWFAARVFVLVGAVNIVVAIAIGDLPAVDFIPLLAVAAIGVVGLILTARLAGCVFRRPANEPRCCGQDAVLAACRPGGGTPGGGSRLAPTGDGRRRLTGKSGDARRAGCGALLADMGCLWASLAAAGVHVGADVVVLAGTAGMLASIVPLVPGGLGLVEAVIPAVLHHFGRHWTRRWPAPSSTGQYPPSSPPGSEPASWAG